MLRKESRAKGIATVHKIVGEETEETNDVQVVPQKTEKQKRINKKSRLVIRNLSFRVTEDKLREYFATCGEITEVNILKKPNGKLVGCAFIQFSTVPQAAKAVRELNLKPFIGRPIAIDWALPKKSFQEDNPKTNTPANPDIKDEPEVKAEPTESDSDLKIKIEQDSDEDSSPNSELKLENSPKEKKPRKRKLKESLSSTRESHETSKSKQPKRNSNDVEEGKTVFIRNLSFNVTEDTIKEFFENFGPLHYALLCKDSLTEHPKGTAFVKFKNQTAANECLAEFEINSSKFSLNGRCFNVTRALPREKIQEKIKEEKTKPPKDSRNLYLAHEGNIRPGSDAARSISTADMNKRELLRRTKKQMLRNLSVFVSKTRLCVHNIPPKINDAALRKIFKQHSPPESKIIEARIMKNFKGQGKSKGYAFVTFTEHEHALAALRAVNNNPAVFTRNQRPIVEFSLENKKAIQAKELRKQKSRQVNSAKNHAKKG